MVVSRQGSDLGVRELPGLAGTAGSGGPGVDKGLVAMEAATGDGAGGVVLGRSDGVTLARALGTDGVDSELMPGRTARTACALRGRALRKLWATRKWLVRTYEDAEGEETTTRQRRVGGKEEVLFRGNAPMCGHPVDGDRMYVPLMGGRIASVSLRTGKLERTVRTPLDAIYCVAPGEGYLAVTGRRGDVGAVATGSKGSWSVVPVTSSRSVLSLATSGQRIAVGAPTEPLKVDGRDVLAAGALYILERKRGKWVVARRLIAEHPTEGGQFGLAAAWTREGLFVNHLGHSASGLDSRGRNRMEFQVCKEVSGAQAP